MPNISLENDVLYVPVMDKTLSQTGGVLTMQLFSGTAAQTPQWHPPHSGVTKRSGKTEIDSVKV